MGRSTWRSDGSPIYGNIFLLDSEETMATLVEK